MNSSLQDFPNFVGQQLQLGAGAQMSPEAALALWREQPAAVAAVRAGLADLQAGKTKPLQQFVADFRTRHGSDQ